MDRIVQFVRWFNRVSPFNQFKPSLAKRAGRRLPHTEGLQIYDGIQRSFRMRLDLGVNYERQIYLHARDIVLLDVVRRILQPGDVYVDVGANLGVLVLAATKRVSPGGKVFAFEPSPQVCERLEENLELNGTHNVTLIRKACSHERSTATLYNFEDKSHDTASIGRRYDAAVSGSVTIETIPIDDVVDERPRLVKIDVEGAEWLALRGAERTLFEGEPPHLIVELNPRASESFGYHPTQVLEWIMERNPRYRVHMIHSKRRHRASVDQVEKYLKKYSKMIDVWFDPE